jgi:DNA-binding MarR family transcriptional regulator
VTTHQDLAASLRLSVGRLARRLRQESFGDLTPSQRSALATLEREGPLRMSDLAAIERITPPSMTGIVGRLEERGLVARIPNPVDARSTMVDLTAASGELLAEMRMRRTAFLASRLAGMSEAEVASLAHAVALLDRIAADE